MFGNNPISGKINEASPKGVVPSLGTTNEVEVLCELTKPNQVEKNGRMKSHTT